MSHTTFSVTQIDGAQALDRADEEPPGLRAGRDALDVVRLLPGRHVPRRDALDELVAAADVVDEHADAAVVDVVPDPRLGDVQQVPLGRRRHLRTPAVTIAAAAVAARNSRLSITSSVNRDSIESDILRPQPGRAGPAIPSCHYSRGTETGEAPRWPPARSRAAPPGKARQPRNTARI